MKTGRGSHLLAVLARMVILFRLETKRMSSDVSQANGRVVTLFLCYTRTRPMISSKKEH